MTSSAARWSCAAGTRSRWWCRWATSPPRGGYLIATEADHIVVEPGSLTGSIGVVSASFALRQALEHFLGVHVGVYETLPHPGSLNALDPPSPADRSRIGKSLDRIYHAFVERVATTRHRSFEAIDKVARGRVWSGQQAVRLGLADEIGGIATALQHVRQRLQLPADAPLQLRVFPEPQTPLDVVRDYISNEAHLAADTQALRQALRLAGHWAQALLGPLTEGYTARL